MNEFLRRAQGHDTRIAFRAGPGAIDYRELVRRSGAIAGQLLGLQQQNLGIDYVTRRNSLVDAVTLEQVKTQAARLLHPDRLIVSVVGKPQGLN